MLARRIIPNLATLALQVPLPFLRLLLGANNDAVCEVLILVLAAGCLLAGGLALRDKSAIRTGPRGAFLTLNFILVVVQLWKLYILNAPDGFFAIPVF
ncbi:MAG: hypothetical protein Q3962_03660 [Corynebacterium sp.]|nr:hypothetical protein [Corynebacterium sp.]